MSTETTVDDPSRQIGEVEIAGTKYPIREGLLLSIEGLPRSTGYAMQKAWYEAHGQQEPARAKARREIAEAAGDKADRVAPAASRPRVDGPSAASLIRKGLAEGQTGAEIMATVRAFGKRCRAADIAYYKAKENA
jgi:hypothetical protein